MFYTLSLLSIVLSLSLWFYTQKHAGISKAFRSFFFLSLVAYAFSILLSPGDLDSKWITVARDLGWMAIIPAALSFLVNKKTSFFLLLGIAALLTGLMAGGTQFDVQKVNTENEWELLVELQEGKDLNVLSAIAKKYGLILEPAFKMEYTENTDLDDFYAVEIPEAKEALLAEITRKIANTPGIDWVEDNETVQVAPIESRLVPGIEKKYGVNDPNLADQWAYAALGVDRFYDFLRTSSGKPVQTAQIFILDTGVDARHEDLAGQYFSTRKSYDKDVRGHGTHCAGIAAAVSNNGIGIASLSPGKSYVKVSSIKVLSDFGVGNQRTIINGMLEAADAGADVISMSLGGRSTTRSQRAYEQAVKYANDAGTIVVVAAGNDAGMAKDISPANVTGVITVSAVDTLLNRASFSNSVAGLKMGLAAPGVAIYSTLPGNKYGALSGTSMATPFVAGLVGMLRSFKPELTTNQVYEILSLSGQTTSRPQETGKLVRPDEALFLLLEGQ
ncbi:MAG: S8 family serine peptidase [Saprospiraceae bacterium]|nr:S8 family serine peptidase [Saprospiraceae bacterium]